MKPFKNILETRAEGKSRPWFSLHRPRDSTKFESESKLLVQCIRNLSLKRRIVATIDNDKLYADHTLNAIILKNPDFYLQFILGIINSNLINFLFQKKYVDINIKGVYLDAIPIPNISKEKQKPLIDKVENILNLKREEIVISKNIKNRLFQNLQIETFTDKLKNFSKLNFIEFFGELKKQKIRLTLQQQEEWEEYFIDKKDLMLKNLEKINQLESDVNSIIYKLYGLNENEIKLIENNL